MMSKEALIKIMEKKYTVFNYDIEEVLRIIARDMKEDSQITKILNSLLNFIHTWLFMRNEYRDIKLIDFNNKLDEDFGNIKNFLEKEKKRIKREINKYVEYNDTYMINSLYLRHKKIDELIRFYEDVFLDIKTIEVKEIEEDKIINTSFMIDKALRIV